MPRPDAQIVLGIGEVLWDCFADRRLPGGAPANVVYHATRLGHHGVLCSRVGQDPLGDELVDVLRSHGLDLDHLQRDSARPTGRVTVDVSDPTSPRFEIHEDVAWDAIELDRVLENLAARSSAVCVGTLAQRSTATRETIRRCLELAAADGLTVYDVNLREPFYRREWIEQTLRFARVVKLNHEEATILTDLLGLTNGDARSFARRIIEKYDVDWVCVTRGADGCLLVSADASHEERGRPVRVVDTVGAGDAFTAALISGLLRGWGGARTARFANRMAAEVAGRAGAMPDLGDALPDLLAAAAQDDG